MTCINQHMTSPNQMHQKASYAPVLILTQRKRPPSQNSFIMATDDNLNCIKFTLFSFNILFLLSGLALIGVGCMVKYEFMGQPFLDNRYVLSADFAILVGSFVVFVTFVGCYGVFQENVCMTLLFTSLLILVLFLELAAGVGAYFLLETSDSYVEKTLHKTMNRYGQMENETLAWDKLQTEFKCCGVTSSKDWKPSFGKHNYPASCMRRVGSTHAHKKGCMTFFQEYVKNHISYIEYVGLSMAVLQLSGVSISCYLSSEIRRNYMMV